MDGFISLAMAVVSYGAVMLAGYIKAKTKKAGIDLNTALATDGAKKAVLAVEQIYKDLNGDEKKQAAINMLVKYLNEHNIPIDENSIEMLIESAVGSMNKGLDLSPKSK